MEPQFGENIGAAARAMKNFGLHDLRVVSIRFEGGVGGGGVHGVGVSYAGMLSRDGRRVFWYSSSCSRVVLLHRFVCVRQSLRLNRWPRCTRS